MQFCVPFVLPLIIDGIEQKQTLWVGDEWAMCPRKSSQIVVIAKSSVMEEKSRNRRMLADVRRKAANSREQIHALEWRLVDMGARSHAVINSEVVVLLVG